jgi:hypothetical protein
MNIDLDSWEVGYAHGQQGRPPRAVSTMVVLGVRNRALTFALLAHQLHQMPRFVDKE